MWKISHRFWINPQSITYVRDFVQQNEIRVFFSSTAHAGQCVIFQGDERAAFLNCLAQHTTVFPRLDDDEPPF